MRLGKKIIEVCSLVDRERRKQKSASSDRSSNVVITSEPRLGASTICFGG
jgi:hypothetical protein